MTYLIGLALASIFAVDTPSEQRFAGDTPIALSNELVVYSNKGKTFIRHLQSGKSQQLPVFGSSGDFLDDETLVLSDSQKTFVINIKSRKVLCSTPEADIAIVPFPDREHFALVDTGTPTWVRFNDYRPGFIRVFNRRCRAVSKRVAAGGTVDKAYWHNEMLAFKIRNKGLGPSRPHFIQLSPKDVTSSKLDAKPSPLSGRALLSEWLWYCPDGAKLQHSAKTRLLRISVTDFCEEYQGPSAISREGKLASIVDPATVEELQPENPMILVFRLGGY